MIAAVDFDHEALALPEEVDLVPEQRDVDDGEGKPVFAADLPEKLLEQAPNRCGRERARGEQCADRTGALVGGGGVEEFAEARPGELAVALRLLEGSSQRH